MPSKYFILYSLLLFINFLAGVSTVRTRPRKAQAACVYEVHRAQGAVAVWV